MCIIYITLRRGLITIRSYITLKHVALIQRDYWLPSVGFEPTHAALFQAAPTRRTKRGTQSAACLLNQT